MSEKLPDGWTEQPLFLFAQIKHGYAFKSAYFREHGHYIVLTPGYFKEEGGMKIPNGKEKYYSAEFPKEFLLKKNDLLIAMTEQAPGLLGSTLFIPEDGVYLHNQRLGLIKINEKRLYPKYLHLYFSLQHVRLLISSMSGGTKVKHTSPDKLLSINIITPTLPEQQKIARILSTWDAAIDCTQKLLENSRKQKKALMQQLLTGKKRLSGFSGEWTSLTIQDLFERVTTRNNGQSTSVVTISAQQGLIRQEEFFKKTVASDTLDNYFLLKKGEFAYNKSYSRGYPVGAIKRLTLYEFGVVTSLYICFKIKCAKECDSDFFEQYFEFGCLNAGLEKVASEGGRAHGLLNVRPSDFFDLELQVPSIEEQTTIAEVLSSCDAVIAQYEAKLANLQAQKKSLMQQLLTGKHRVKVDDVADTSAASAS